MIKKYLIFQVIFSVVYSAVGYLFLEAELELSLLIKSVIIGMFAFIVAHLINKKL